MKSLLVICFALTVILFVIEPILTQANQANQALKRGTGTAAQPTLVFASREIGVH